MLTDAGLVVANPVFADGTRQRQLGRTAYHGTVTWSWQQALLAAGLERQVARRDLPAETTKRLREAQQRLWSVIANTRELRASELWSWRYVDGRYQAAPFGRTAAMPTNRTPRSYGARSISRSRRRRPPTLPPHGRSSKTPYAWLQIASTAGCLMLRSIEMA